VKCRRVGQTVAAFNWSRHCMHVSGVVGFSASSSSKVDTLNIWWKTAGCDSYFRQQEAFEKCWAHSPQRAASRQFTRCRHCTVARRLRIDVHDANDDNDNAWQRGPLWPYGMGPITETINTSFPVVNFLTCVTGVSLRDVLQRDLCCLIDHTSSRRLGLGVMINLYLIFRFVKGCCHGNQVMLKETRK